MALINCPECGKEISDSAITCPNCGVSLKKESDFDSLNNTSVKKRKTVPIVIVVIVSVFVLLAAAYFCRGLFVSEINLKCKGSTFLKIGDSTSITAAIMYCFMMRQCRRFLKQLLWITRKKLHRKERGKYCTRS